MARMKANVASPDTVALDSVETMLLGGAPVDALDLRQSGDRRVQLLADIRAYLKERPELRTETAQEVGLAWQKARGDRTAFRQNVAERRAQLLTLAQIDRAKPDSARVAQDFDNELTRYLTQMQGLGTQP